MKTILRVFGKLNRRALGIAFAAIIISCTILTSVRAQGVLTRDPAPANVYDSAWYYKEAVYYTYIWQNIERIYGTEAKDAYLEATKTGDYTAYRTLTGNWNPTCLVEGINVHTDGRNLVGNELTGAQSIENTAYKLFGKYGTGQDVYDYAAQYGYNLNDSDQFNKFTLAWAVYKTVPKPAKKAAPAKTTAAKAAPAANNSQVEALKSFKGNTAEFNAYFYYTNYPDLQAAFGADGTKLKNHFSQYGKAEGRVANKSIK